MGAGVDVKFRTKGLGDHFKNIDPSYYYYQFEIRADFINLMLEFHKDKYEELTEEISDKMQQAKSLFGERKKTLKKDWVWNRVWTIRTNDINNEKWIHEKLNLICAKDGTNNMLVESKSTE